MMQQRTTINIASLSRLSKFIAGRGSMMKSGQTAQVLIWTPSFWALALSSLTWLAIVFLAAMILG
jgi:hypothetical protein